MIVACFTLRMPLSGKLSLRPGRKLNDVSQFLGPVSAA